MSTTTNEYQIPVPDITINWSCGSESIRVELIGPVEKHIFEGIIGLIFKVAESAHREIDRK